MGEHLPCKQGVKSSNLSVSTQAYYTRALEVKQSAKKHKPYLENRIMKLILKVSKMMIMIRHPRPTEMLEQ